MIIQEFHFLFFSSFRARFLVEKERKSSGKTQPKGLRHCVKCENCNFYHKYLLFLMQCLHSQIYCYDKELGSISDIYNISLYQLRNSFKLIVYGT